MLGDTSIQTVVGHSILKDNFAFNPIKTILTKLCQQGMHPLYIIYQVDNLVRRHSRAFWRISYLTGMAPYPQLHLMHGFMQLVDLVGLVTISPKTPHVNTQISSEDILLPIHIPYTAVHHYTISLMGNALTSTFFLILFSIQPNCNNFRRGEINKNSHNFYHSFKLAPNQGVGEEDLANISRQLKGSNGRERGGELRKVCT